MTTREIAMKSTSPLYLAIVLLASALALTAAAKQGGNPQGLLTLTPEQKEILRHMSIEYLDDGQGGTVKTIRVTAANWQVVNGQGATGTTNGLGNLVIGYNELGNSSGDDRTGSHSLVVGRENSFTSFGGIVGGRDNTVTGEHSTVTGGQDNLAMGAYSSVIGGLANVAGDLYSTVIGGVGSMTTDTLEVLPKPMGRHAFGTADMPNNPGLQSITGLGFKPSHIRIRQAEVDSGSFNGSEGLGDSAHQSFASLGAAEFYGGPTIDGAIGGREVVAAGTNGFQTTVTLISLDLDGFTLSWTMGELVDVPSFPEDRFLWEAFE
ncbi:MAG: hypothetical protein ACI9OJ_001620 [Myxococcota bacterium]